MWTCPKCERKIVHANKWHYCEKVGIDSLFEGKREELILLFDRLLSHIISWEDVGVSATKNCIVFVHRQTFFIVRPMKKVLSLKFYSAQEKTGYPILKSTAVHGHVFLKTIKLPLMVNSPLQIAGNFWISLDPVYWRLLNCISTLATSPSLSKVPVYSPRKSSIEMAWMGSLSHPVAIKIIRKRNFAIFIFHLFKSVTIVRNLLLK